jgi:SAM-dependent methyltransferase
LNKNKNLKTLNIFGLGTVLFFLSIGGAAAVQQQLFHPEVPFVPTPHEVVAEILRLADVGKADVLYDLGCGDGRIVVTAAKKYGCRGVGIDIDPERIQDSQKNAAKEGVEDKVRFIESDLFDADISKASVVTLYLLSRVNIRLRPKLLSELKPGTRVVSHDFDMDEWEADEISYIEDDWETHSIFFWIIPADVSGTWKWTLPELAGQNEFTLVLEQDFQKLQGTASEGSSSVPVFITEDKIKGADLEFVLERNERGKKERLVFKGKADGEVMKGLVTIESGANKKSYNWSAKRIKNSG